jgi:hypothetical protein
LKLATDFYVQLHKKHLQSLSPAEATIELDKCQNIFEHMYLYFLDIGLDTDEAISIVDDFRSDFVLENSKSAG